MFYPNTEKFRDNIPKLISIYPQHCPQKATQRPSDLLREHERWYIIDARPDWHDVHRHVRRLALSIKGNNEECILTVCPRAVLQDVPAITLTLEFEHEAIVAERHIAEPSA